MLKVQPPSFTHSPHVQFLTCNDCLMPRFDTSLVIVIKLGAKYRFYAVAVLVFYIR